MKKRRLILLLLAAVIVLCLSGCVNVATTMTVDGNFAGQRVMNLSFSADLMQTEGVLADMDNHIAAAKPPEMEFYRTDSADPIEYVFTVRFDSLDEYKQKIKMIAGREVSVDFAYINEPFSRDMKLVEDFDSSELFGWFEEVLESQRDVIEGAMGAPVDLTQLWKVNGYTLEIAGESFSSSNSTINYTRGGGDLISGVEITTVLHGNEQYTRYIEYKFSDKSNEGDQTDVIELLSTKIPEGATIEQSVGADGASCTVSFSATTTQQLADLTTMALDGRRATATWGDVNDPERPLTTLCGLEESFDISSFTTDSKLEFVYRIVSESGLPDNMYSKTGGGMTPLDAEISSNTITYRANGTTFGLYSLLAKVNQAQTINYGLVVENEDKLIREIRIILPPDAQPEVISQIEAYYANRGANNTDIITSGSAELPFVLITIKGNAAEICAAEDILFGVSADRRLSYTRDGGLFKVKPDAMLVDSYDITSLLSMTGVQEYIYVVHTGDNVYSCSAAADNSNLPTKGPVAVLCSDGAQRLSFIGTYVNSDAIIFICLLVVLALLLAALAVTLYISKKMEKESSEEKPAELTEGEQIKALPESEPRDFIAVMEDPEPIVPTSPVEMELFEAPEPEPEEDMLGIFTGADLGEESYEPEPVEDPIQIEEIPVEIKSEPEPEPEPEPQPEPEPDEFEEYEDRFPMENLPPVVESPENSTDKYSDSDFISDLRYLGYLDDYAKRKSSRVKVKVRKKSPGEDK